MDNRPNPKADLLKEKFNSIAQDRNSLKKGSLERQALNLLLKCIRRSAKSPEGRVPIVLEDKSPERLKHIREIFVEAAEKARNYEVGGFYPAEQREKSEGGYSPEVEVSDLSFLE